MKKQLFVLLLAFFGFAMQSQANASAYVIDDAAVEAVFESAVQVNAMPILSIADINDGTATLAADKSPTVAWILSWFGGLGVHRWYLGTDTSTKILYCVTAGG